MSVKTSILPEILIKTENALYYHLHDDGVFPNSRLPLIVYKKSLELPEGNEAKSIENLFHQNNWANSWRDTIFNYHHYHSITHEVLAAFRASTRVQLGGDDGISFMFEKGDVVIIPAGVVHRNLSPDNDFRCVGAYPNGKDFDMNYGKPGERPGTDKNIGSVNVPETDPVFGSRGGILTLWDWASLSRGR